MKLTDDLIKMFLTEEVDHGGIARCTVAAYPGLFRHNNSFGWLKYNGKFWEKEGAAAAVSRAIQNVLEERRVAYARKEEFKKSRACRCWNSTIRNVMSLIKDRADILTAPADFDNGDDLINCANGLFNMRSGELIPHSPDQLFTYALKVKYNPEADYSHWLEFMYSCGLDSDMINYLQMAFGYIFTGYTSEEILFYVWGLTRSGKGTLIETITEAFSPLGVGVSMTTFTSKRTGDTNNFDLAPLKDKRMVTASETSRHGSLNAAFIKAWTGGDTISASFKGKNTFYFRPQFKIVMSSNFPVNVDVDDDAAWGRIRVIHFPNSFLGKEDKGLKARLKTKESLEGVLLWILSGAVSWYEIRDNGLPLPDKVKQATDEHRAALDSIAQFIGMSCKTGKDYYTVGKHLYSAYKMWAEEEGYKPYGRKRFTQVLEKRGHVSKTKRIGGKVTRIYDNIGLLQDEV